MSAWLKKVYLPALLLQDNTQEEYEKDAVLKNTLQGLGDNCVTWSFMGPLGEGPRPVSDS